ncbi:iron complex transport system ATP-binding protein [Pseudomonas sp. NFACC32-1]|uniref:ABC transporter ATP-binding protein n=1 Tax=Pseudomonas TaxID=286 RepID=UPI0008768018|nr:MULTISPECIES: ABC transporter ATP-binding protein [Pseudomonas]MDB6445106.1 ABC transporter ATP-binding protein [Pseudomonas sp. 21TX0197]MDT8907601.1 ABC transporter ATP-binding protein [Pseudomonas prosekii]NHN70288.1 ABC transporter ATP-binding protein [Pseudomonas fluorescens]ROO39211.1 histidinol phosphatase [Pseudomonas sp. AF76]ROO39449.1 histidinol phosphatase [Pseudomonas sp. 7SR1]
MTSLSLTHLAWTPLGHGHCHHQFQLRDVTLQVAAGEFVGLIGPNGSGKTSLLRCAYRFSRPEHGEVKLAHYNVWQQSSRWCAQRIAVVLQEFPDAFGLTVEEVVAMGRTPHKGLFDGDDHEDRRLVRQALASAGLEGFGDHAFATLSGGEKQRVILARALAQQPQLLILDEPTNHLDPRYQLQLLQLIKGLGIGTLASLHDLNLAAAFCDRLYVIDHGQIVASGTPAEVLTAALLREVFGIEALVDEHPLAGYPRITWITQQ